MFLESIHARWLFISEDLSMREEQKSGLTQRRLIQLITLLLTLSLAIVIRKYLLGSNRGSANLSAEGDSKKEVSTQLATTGQKTVTKILQQILRPIEIDFSHISQLIAERADEKKDDEMLEHLSAIKASVEVINNALLSRNLTEVGLSIALTAISNHGKRITKTVKAIKSLAGTVNDENIIIHKVCFDIDRSVCRLHEYSQALSSTPYGKILISIEKIKSLYISQAVVAVDRKLRLNLNLLLAEIAKLNPSTQNKSCFISYAWPTDDNLCLEFWIQPFLFCLYDHLQIAGIIPRLDIIDNKHTGADISKFSREVLTTDWILLVGSRSLWDKKNASTRYHVVQDELNYFKDKKEADANQGYGVRVFPVLLAALTEDGRDALSDQRGRTMINDWRNNTYLKNLQLLLQEIYYPQQSPPQEYQLLWEQFHRDNSAAIKQPVSPEMQVYHQQEFKRLQADNYYQDLLSIKYPDPEKVCYSRPSVYLKMIKSLQEKFSFLMGSDSKPTDLYSHSLYMPCVGKARNDSVPKDLYDSVHSFFTHTDARLMLILGDSGAGKTMFCHDFVYRHIHEIKQLPSAESTMLPIYVSLSTLKDPKSCLLEEVLDQYGFSEAKAIDDLLSNYSCLFLLDGYDEMTIPISNLYVSNKLWQWQKAKFIICCRAQYLASQANYSNYFEPVNPWCVEDTLKDSSSFLEVRIMPFSNKQVEEYIQSYINNNVDRTNWQDAQQCLSLIKSIPGLLDLIKNPFLLFITMKILPNISKQYAGQPLVDRARMTAKKLYDGFVEMWFRRQHYKLLLDNDDDPNRDVIQDFWQFSKALAVAMKNARVTTVQYSGYQPALFSAAESKDSWDRFFSDHDQRVKRARRGCPLRQEVITSNNGGTLCRYSFLHASLLNYFYESHLSESVNQVISSCSGLLTSTTKQISATESKENKDCNSTTHNYS